MAKILEDITEDGVKYHLGKLRKEGKVECIGGYRGGYWKINPEVQQLSEIVYLEFKV